MGRSEEADVNEFLLIGVDGGATEVKAHAVACDDLGRRTSFRLRPESASRVYPRLPGFVPLSVTEQLAQRDSGDLRRSAEEIEQASRWVTAAAEAVVDVARQCGVARVLVGVGMPGLKTPDGRGINVINNGPRIPDYLDRFEQQVAAAGITLLAPVAALGSDADYCGLGEEYADEGLFRDVQNAYYCGGGTGIADALKLRGRLVPFDQARTWIQKSWQIPSALGPTFEKLVSASSLNRVWTELNAVTPRPPVDPTPYPEVAALTGDPLAAGWLATAALVLAELIFERLWTIRNGRAAAAQRGEAYARLAPEHEYRGLLLDRVVIGQRVGLIYGDPRFRPVFGHRVDAYLAAFVARSGDADMSAAYLQLPTGGGANAGQASATLKAGFLRASRLRAAPALGAAIAALQTFVK